MRLLVECWEPDWATWACHAWRTDQGAVIGHPVIGWMTYLSRPFMADRLPPGATLQNLGSGSLVTTADSVAGVTTTALLTIRKALGL